MEEIKVGEYVRTKYGEIAKITQTFPQIKGIKKVNPSLIDFNLIVKHSFNIIDLIEVGDIVEISDVLHNDIFHIWSEDMVKALKEDIENGIQLKSIVTKEQFQNIKYKLEE